MTTQVLVRSMRSVGEVMAIARQLSRCAEDVTELIADDPLLAPEGAVLNARLAEAMEAARTMIVTLDARLDVEG